MTEEHATDPDDSQQGGVFGNLPGSRPGTRSPRRDAARQPRDRRRGEATGAKPRLGTKQADDPAPADAPSRSAAPGPKRPTATPGLRREPHAAPEPPSSAGGPGLEDLAWAGIAAAAEAATLGVRLASRAMEALRDTVDRR